MQTFADVLQSRCFAKSTGQHLNWSRLFSIKLQVLDLRRYQKETAAKVFSCRFFEILKNTSGQLLLNLNTFNNNCMTLKAPSPSPMSRSRHLTAGNTEKCSYQQGLCRRNRLVLLERHWTSCYGGCGCILQARGKNTFHEMCLKPIQLLTSRWRNRCCNQGSFWRWIYFQ